MLKIFIMIKPVAKIEECVFDKDIKCYGYDYRTPNEIYHIYFVREHFV